MKEILDRHAERLSPAERQAIWRTVSRKRAPEPRSALLRALAAATAVVTASLIAVVIANREPPTPPRSGLASPHVIAPRVEIVVPKAPPSDAPRDAALAIAESLARIPVAPRLAARHPTAQVRPGAGAVAGVNDDSGYQPLPVGPQSAAGEITELKYPPVPVGTQSSTGRMTGTVTEKGRTPIEFANVIILGTKLGTMTDANGNFVLTGVPVGAQQVQVQPLGYDKQVQGIQVDAGATTTVSFNFSGSKVVKMIEEIGVCAAKGIDTKSSTSVQSILAQKPGQSQSGDKHHRGGRGSEVKYGIPGAQAVPVQPPVIPTTGGTRLPNDEPYDSMFFRNYGVNPFIATDEDSLSTFAVDVDAASYTVARRYIELGHLPPAEAVRVEEFVNFFPQGYPKFENEDFRILVDGAPSRFGHGYHLLRVGIKGRQIAERDRRPARLTFVIDVSGSMEREDRLELVKQALRLLVNQLRDDDRVGIVVFGTDARVLLEPVTLGESVALVAGVYRPAAGVGDDQAEGGLTGRRGILEAIDWLHPEGSTNTEQGLLLGYEMARGQYRPEANNRIVLCSDGVANVGNTGPQSILERVRTEADRGIHLSTIGFGMGNYNDVLMEQLADKGDGNYYYVDDLAEARRVFVENLTGTLQTIAKDAKIQVEFDPSRVLRYRLLGFENRDVADRDFRNDKVDAGEIGAGHEVTALYEVKLAPRADRGPIATVRLRYARPGREGGGAPQVREIAAEFRAAELSRRFEDASPYFRLDAAVAEFAEILRGSYWAKESRLTDVLPVARSAARGLRESAAAEFVSRVEQAARIRSAAPAEAPKDDP